MLTTSPSPSPPPPAPLPLTPGARARKLQEVYTKALAATLSSITLSSFSACFPTIAATAPGALQALHSGLISRLEEFANDEFERIMVERKVVEVLNALEEVVAEGKRRKARSVGDEVPVAPHMLSPQPLMAAHLSPLHAQQQNQLNAKMQTVASQNAKLAGEISQQREEIERLVSMVEMLVRDLEGSVEGMEGLEGGSRVEGLSAKAREAEGLLVQGGGAG